METAVAILILFNCGLTAAYLFLLDRQKKTTKTLHEVCEEITKAGDDIPLHIAMENVWNVLDKHHRALKRAGMLDGKEKK